MPTGSTRVYVRLWQFSHSWQYNDYQYNNETYAPNFPDIFTPSHDEDDVSSTQLTVKAVDPQSDTMSVTFYGREVDDSCDFKVVVIPDTQWLTWDEEGNSDPTYSWVFDDMVERIIAINPAAVLHVGDIVQDEEITLQWQNAKDSMDLLRTPDIPYILAVGNHDQAISCNATSSTANFRSYFPLSDFTSKSWWGGYYTGDQDNRWIKFTAGGLKWGIITLEINTSYYTGAGNWVKSVVDDGSNSDRRFLLVTHGLLQGFTGVDIAGEWTGTGHGGDGQGIYNAMKGHNIDFMFCGHRIGAALRMDTYNNRTIYSTLFNYQDNYPVPYPDHLPFEGWIRILTFSPKNNNVHVKTYMTVPEEYEWTSYSAPTITYNMGGNPPSYSIIGTDTGVISGTNASVTWQNLENDKTYEWYAVISDGTNTRIGPVLRFKTSSP